MADSSEFAACGKPCGGIAWDESWFGNLVSVVTCLGSSKACKEKA